MGPRIVETVFNGVQVLKMAVGDGDGSSLMWVAGDVHLNDVVVPEYGALKHALKECCPGWTIGTEPSALMMPVPKEELSNLEAAPISTLIEPLDRFNKAMEPALFLKRETDKPIYMLGHGLDYFLVESCFVVPRDDCQSFTLFGDYVRLDHELANLWQEFSTRANTLWVARRRRQVQEVTKYNRVFGPVVFVPFAESRPSLGVVIGDVNIGHDGY